MNLRNQLTDLSLKGMNGLHRTILKVSGGRWLNRPLGMPTVELHTIGRKSGKPRATLLTAPIHDDRHTVLIASKGGDDRNPEWYLNLVAHPDIDLTIDGETASDAGPHRVRGREERDVAGDRRREQGLRRIPEEDDPSHPGRGLRTATLREHR